MDPSIIIRLVVRQLQPRQQQQLRRVYPSSCIPLVCFKGNTTYSRTHSSYPTGSRTNSTTGSSSISTDYNRNLRRSQQHFLYINGSPKSDHQSFPLSLRCPCRCCCHATQNITNQQLPKAKTYQSTSPYFDNLNIGNKGDAIRRNNIVGREYSSSRRTSTIQQSDTVNSVQDDDDITSTKGKVTTTATTSLNDVVDNHLNNSTNDHLTTTTVIDNTTTDDNSDDTAWIPPNRPLLGDVGQAHLYAHVVEDKELHELLSDDGTNDNNATAATATMTAEESRSAAIDAELIDASSIDWLKTRRRQTMLLSEQMMMKPDDASWYKESIVDKELPVIEHTLYTEQQLVQCLHALGGQDIQVIIDNSGNGTSHRRRRFGKDVNGIILVTGNNYIQMQQMANHMVRQLRRRNLQDVGIVGAQLGVDGNMNDPNENWYVIDCGNYIVHIQDAITRTSVNLAGLWSGQDPIRTVDCTNEDAVEDYVAQHPVPANYTVGGTIPLSQLYNVYGISTQSGNSDWDRTTIKQFEKGRFGTRTSKLIAASNRKSANIPRRKTSGRKT